MGAKRILVGAGKEFQLAYEWADWDPERKPQEVYLEWTKENGAGKRTIYMRFKLGSVLDPSMIEFCEALNAMRGAYEGLFQQHEFYRYMFGVTRTALNHCAEVFKDSTAIEAVCHMDAASKYFNRLGTMDGFEYPPPARDSADA